MWVSGENAFHAVRRIGKRKQYYMCKINAFVLLSVVCSRHRKNIALYCSSLHWSEESML